MIGCQAQLRTKTAVFCLTINQPATQLRTQSQVRVSKLSQGRLAGSLVGQGGSRTGPGTLLGSLAQLVPT